jgi:SAM-dependent methyltransferase
MSQVRSRSVLRRLLGAARRAVFPARPLPRAQYKAVWDRQSATEDAAKVAVAGYTDEAEFGRTAAATADMLDRCVGVRPTDRVLEIGAGVGRVGAVLAPRCAEWVGADVSPRMVGYIRSRLAALPNARAVEVSGYDLAPLPDASFDLVYCTVVFMHLDEWDRYNYVVEGLRVLRPGGRMLVDNFNLLSEEGWALFEQLRRLPPAARPAHISKSSTPQELAEYFRRAGFTGIGGEERGMWATAWGRKPG